MATARKKPAQAKQRQPKPKQRQPKPKQRQPKSKQRQPKPRWLLEAILAPSETGSALYRPGLWYALNLAGGFTVDDGTVPAYCGFRAPTLIAKEMIAALKTDWEAESRRRWVYTVSTLPITGGKLLRTVSLWG